MEFIQDIESQDTSDARLMVLDLQLDELVRSKLYRRDVLGLLFVCRGGHQLHLLRRSEMEGARDRCIRCCCCNNWLSNEEIRLGLML
jgi:hypothetical protein